MSKKIKYFSKQLNDISREIEESLERLDSKNFSTELVNFGYKHIYVDSTMSKDTRNEKLKEIKNYPGIYIFMENSKICITKTSWKSFKKCMEPNMVPQWNSIVDSNNNIFYLGKSNSIGQRVKEHMTKAAKSTYALKLEEFKEKYCSNLNYTVDIFFLAEKDNSKKMLSLN
ncbi:hypothetical protein [Nosocomiicoccus ampullae]|uniref:hypothetical protein n=1 Tax=Nosocomiicoccus ampullae TaxID=489910 RepID=UPI00254EEA55|nr:hypothetical protein [Nosocomiicoccus ampullae]MDK6862761.1 hypothetical protein [Nosocomiicoccus ampullae]